MFILYAVIIGLAVGLLGGGKLAAIADIRFRWAPLVMVGFLAQVLLFSDAVAARVGDLGPVLYVASTLLVVVAVVRNLAIPGLPLVALGAASNLVAIVANGGFMPASPAALAALGKDVPTIYSNSAVVAQPALFPLTDVFALPMWLPFHNIFSVGDVILAVGVAFVIATAMRRTTGAGRALRPGGA
ncbi:MAG TPA: DUF5317 family protein [Candidatus Limnocylindrales bacterium]